MRLGRLGFVGLVTVLLGCATAESIEDEGVGGSPVGGSTGSGGKTDNPGGGGSGNAGGGAAGDPGSGGTSAGGSSAGGSSSGGTSAGGTSSGGTSAGGTSAGGGSGGTCAAGQKKCTGVCIAPNPIVGCALDTQCAGCPAPPANGTSVCSGTLCDFTCPSGFTKGTNTCISSGGGGAPSGGGGTSGSGGASGCAAPCNPSDITSQFLCTFYCATQTGNPGICAPVINCCACP